MKDDFNIDTMDIEELRRGYREITGLENDSEFTDDEICEYMKEACAEDEEL